MDSLKSFCADNLRHKQLKSEFKLQMDPLRVRSRDCKQKIDTHMQEHNITTAVVNLDSNKVTYLTRRSKTQNRRIKRETVETGLKQTMEEYSLPAFDKKILSKLVWENINNALD